MLRILYQIKKKKKNTVKNLSLHTDAQLMECSDFSSRNEANNDEVNNLDHWKLFCAARQRQISSSSMQKTQILQEIQTLKEKNGWVINFILPLSSEITSTNYSTFLPNETIAYDKKEKLSIDTFS